MSCGDGEQLREHNASHVILVAGQLSFPDAAEAFEEATWIAAAAGSSVGILCSRCLALR